MDNFVVSARKYRPSTFDTVVGQSHITTTLKNAIKNNHLAQAFLFCGPRGVGKTTNARILAKTINCENITPEIEACNVCESCKSFNNNASFNVHELDAASNNSVDDIRSLVDQVRYPPQYGKYKIYIIDEVHMLSNAAFNAFLKTLEEPPSYAIFILATTEKHKIIPTILSRCQIFDFNRIQVKDISEHLAFIAKKEDIKYEPQALHLIAQKADGALRDALSIFDLIVTFSSNNTVTYKTTIDNLHILDYDYYFKMTDFLYNQNLSQSLITFDQIVREGFDGHNFIVGLSEHFRNLLVCKDAVTLKLLEVADEIKMKYQAQANAVPISFLMSALNIGNSCDLQYKSSKNQRLHVELALMKMAYLNTALNFSKGLPSSPEEVKKKPELIAPNPLTEEKKTEDKKEESPLTEILLGAQKALANPVKVPVEPIRTTVKIPTLKDLKKDAAANQVLEEKVEKIEKVIDNPFAFDELQKYWKHFASTIKDKKSQFIILDREIILQENFAIRLVLDNPLQVDQLNAFKPDLLEYLRKNLNNNQIKIETEIVSEENTKKIYTARDKYQYLAQKYPLLEDMKKRFGLDTDY